MKQISTHLWFDKEAVQAAQFYATVFPDASIAGTSQIHHTPSGSVDIVELDISGQHFTLISAGPMFRVNASISFLVACNSREEVDALYARLADEGTDLMPLDSYPFSERYAWVVDRYGLSWQLYFNSGSPINQVITPTLMFSGAGLGKAEEAMQYYSGVFAGYGTSGVGGIARYGSAVPERDGMIMHASFTLAGQEFYAMDSGVDQDVPFNEAISFMVHCDSQAEIDYFWGKLSAVPEAEQCGWLKDRFGLSWQIVPAAMMKMMLEGTPEQIARVTAAFMQMKKFDLAALERAYKGGKA